MGGDGQINIRLKSTSPSFNLTSKVYVQGNGASYPGVHHSFVAHSSKARKAL